MCSDDGQLVSVAQHEMCIAEYKQRVNALTECYLQTPQTQILPAATKLLSVTPNFAEWHQSQIAKNIDIKVYGYGHHPHAESHLHAMLGGSVAEWLACQTQARKSTGSNRSRDAVE